MGREKDQSQREFCSWKSRQTRESPFDLGTQDVYILKEIEIVKYVYVYCYGPAKISLVCRLTVM